MTAPLRSETEWRDAERTFSFGDAAAVEVIGRVRQKEATLMPTVWFSNLLPVISRAV